MRAPKRFSGSRDTETAVESSVSSHSLLRSVIENLDSSSRKTVSWQMSDTWNFDNDTEKRSKLH